MSKAADMAKTSARGGFHLLWGLVISTVISSVGTIVIGNLLSADDMGIYYIALAGPTLIQNFRDWGVGAAMIKYSAQYNSENQISKVKSIIISGLTFQVILGLLLNFFTIGISEFLATSVYDHPEIVNLIQISSFILLAGALTSTAQAVFVGLEKMAYNSINLVIQAVVKTILMIVLVVYGLGALGAVLGAVVSLLISSLTGMLLLLLIYRNFKDFSLSFNLEKNIKLMLKYGLPLSVGTIVGGFLLQFYNILLANFVSDAVIGNYSIANTFVVLIAFFATPVNTMLFPAFSKLDAKTDPQTLRSVFNFSVKYGSLLVVPVAMLVMALSKPAVYALFGDKFEFTPLFLALLAINHLFVVTGKLSVGNLLNGQGETRLNMLFILLTSGIGFPLSYFLTAWYGVVGLIIAILTAGFPTLIISRIWIWRRYSLTIDWLFAAKIFVSSGLSAFLTYFITTYYISSYWAQLVVGVFVFLVSFLVLVLVTKTVERSDIDNLENMIQSLGPLSKIFTFVFKIVEKLMNIFGM